MNTKLVGIYLNDHLAGSVVGGELAKRAASSNSGTALGDFLANLAEEIDDEREVLKSLLDHYGVPQNRIKAPVAWVAEKLGRLKLNGQVTGYSPLSRLVELEGLTLGVTGKLGMWRALAATQSGLEAYGIDKLISQAEAQRDELERRRLEAAELAFGPRASSPSA
jgi:hypothetical protein